MPAPENGELRVVIGEFGRHLDMLAEQLGASLSEADRDCVSVGESFHDLADAKNKMADINCDEPGQTVLKRSTAVASTSSPGHTVLNRSTAGLGGPGVAVTSAPLAQAI